MTYSRLNGCSVTTILGTLYRELTGLLGAIASRTSVAIQLSANGGLVPIQQLGDLRSIVSGFHE
jgi:hypothetical protein